MGPGKHWQVGVQDNVATLAGTLDLKAMAELAKVQQTQ